MPTNKKRINVSLPDHVAIFLQEIAVRDDVPQATKAAELLERALELEEDAFFSRLAEKREKEGGSYISHEDFWSDVV